MKRSNFPCVCIGNISQYGSGERCGPWDSWWFFFIVFLGILFTTCPGRQNFNDRYFGLLMHNIQNEYSIYASIAHKNDTSNVMTEQNDTPPRFIFTTSGRSVSSRLRTSDAEFVHDNAFLK
jgi:hypothetical protein